MPDDPDSDGETADDACEDGVGEDCPSSTTGPSTDVLLGLALLVVLLVVAALVRTRRAEQGMLVDDYAAFDDVSDEV